MGSERVVLDGASPVGVDYLRPLVLRADSVHPVVFVGEASPRPAEHRNLQLLEGLHYILPVAVDIRDVGILSDPQAVIDASSQMLCELSVDFLGDDRLVLRTLVHIDFDLGCCAQRESHYGCGYQYFFHNGVLV